VSRPALLIPMLPEAMPFTLPKQPVSTVMIPAEAAVMQTTDKATGGLILRL
jgi:hypothetical protein